MREGAASEMRLGVTEIKRRFDRRGESEYVKEFSRFLCFRETHNSSTVNGMPSQA